MILPPSRRPIVVLAALVALTPSLCAQAAPAAKPPAKPSIKQACADSFARVQQHRRVGKLIEARSEAKACARDICPAVTQNDCARWATELEDEVPSVLVRVLDGAGHEIVDAEVTLDGEPFEALRSGLAAELNPGSHVFEIAHGSGPPMRRDIVLYERQKARLIDFSLEQAPPPPPPRRASPVNRPTEAPGTPTLVYVLGGVGVAGLVGFGALGLSTRGSYYDLERTCGQSCPEDKVDSVKRRALLADLSLGVGVVALGAAAYFFFRPRDASPPSSAASFDLLALPGGGGLVARRTF